MTHTEAVSVKPEPSWLKVITVIGDVLEVVTVPLIVLIVGM